MEQYIHILIAINPEYVPNPSQIAEFFDALVGPFSFRIIRDGRWQPGLRIMKPGGRTRTGRNGFTGETFTIPVPDQVMIESTNEISKLIDGLEEYRVAASGEWSLETAPLVLLNTDKTPFKENPICDVSCNIRPAPVSTSAWDEEAGPNVRSVPEFGTPWNGEGTIGVFPNPWTGEVIEVPNAACARFWIEFEFGKFIYPKIEKSLEVFSPTLVRMAEECFQANLVQGCRFW